MGEQLFRTLTFVLLIVFGIIWGANLLRVRGSGSLLYSRREGVLLAAAIRIPIVASLGALSLYLVSPHAMEWSRVSLPTWLRLGGIAIGGLGVCLLHWVLVTLGRNFSMSLAIKPHQALVTSGPYHWVRHPMYPAFVLVFAGLFLLSASWFIGGTAALAFGAAMVLRTPQEEQMLIEAFGEKYLIYRRRTGRFLPKLFG